MTCTDHLSRMRAGHAHADIYLPGEGNQVNSDRERFRATTGLLLDLSGILIHRYILSATLVPIQQREDKRMTEVQNVHSVLYLLLKRPAEDLAFVRNFVAKVNKATAVLGPNRQAELSRHQIQYFGKIHLGTPATLFSLGRADWPTELIILYSGAIRRNEHIRRKVEAQDFQYIRYQ